MSVSAEQCVPRHQMVAGVYGSRRAWWLAERARTQPKTLWVVIANNARELEHWATDLAFFAPELRQYTLPSWELLPYEPFSPHNEIVSARLHTLNALLHKPQGVVLTTIAASCQRLSPKPFVEATQWRFAVGERIDLHAVRVHLVELGYASVSQVSIPGEFALRGSVLDVFPLGQKQPVRIDCLDEDIESLRTFDPESQRSLNTLDQFTLLPRRELRMDAQAIATFRRNFRKAFTGNPADCALYRDVSDGRAPDGVEQYLPLFFETTTTVFDYLPDHAHLVLQADALTHTNQFWDMTKTRFADRAGDSQRPPLPPEQLFISTDHWQAHVAAYSQTTLCGFDPSKTQTDVALSKPLPPLSRLTETTAMRTHDASIPKSTTKTSDDLTADWLHQRTGRTLLVVESAGRREALMDGLRAHRLTATSYNNWQSFIDSDSSLAITHGIVSEGFIDDATDIAVVPADAVLKKVAPVCEHKARTQDGTELIAQLADLKIGAPVVHDTYGVGRYRGLTSLDITGSTAEYLQLEYAEGDTIYVPVYALHLVSRYVGADGEHAPLHKLGSDQWQKARRKAAKAVRDIAAELLDLYARRAARPGVAFDLDERDYAKFCADFPFTETPDQATTISHVEDDLLTDKVMDRVVCGDVGFGKTEVALRAAFIAAMQGFQVAVLVPTTLLAQQHAQTFRDRFADWPIKIGELTRFRTKKESDATLAALADGSLDIVIGTHKLLQPSVRFHNLGLLVIDEEHRFGVRHKEMLKSLRDTTDALTLTATPIPRTLNLALGGLRDISLITTPPPSRVAINTLVCEWKDAVVADACARELARGGQVYFVHNKVQTIEATREKLQALLPQARIAVAHGQMRERELETIMLAFYRREYDVLLCTTIIESGLDVPSANTIIIDRADKLGLAQLHQLRGRVGRAHHRAFAYFIVPPAAVLTEDARKRLEAIVSTDTLGAGFMIATHDLEIRGAGDLLGEKQSGQMHEVGFALYTRMLERTVKALRAGDESIKGPDYFAPLSAPVEINIGAPAFLPANYLPDVELRLRLYKRIAACPLAELDALRIEMIDRFGVLPDEGDALFALSALKSRAEVLGIEKLEAHAQGGRCVFTKQTQVQPEALLRFIEHAPQVYQLDGSRTLRFGRALEEADARITFLNALLDQLER